MSTTEETIIRDQDKEISTIIRRELADEGIKRQCQAASEALELLASLPEDLPQQFALEARRWLTDYIIDPDNSAIAPVTIQFNDATEANAALKALIEALHERGKDAYYATRIVQRWLAQVARASFTGTSHG